MTEIYVKALIPILILTLAEIAFFFLVGTKDVESSIERKLKNGIKSLLEKKSIPINSDVISVLKVLNERTHNCSIKNRENINGKLLLRALFLVFLIMSMIIWLFPGVKPTNSWLEWWIVTFIESVILVGLLAYFQLLFLNTIIKNPKMIYFTNEEIMYHLHTNLKNMKEPTL